jgi:hypothetical protein
MILSLSSCMLATQLVLTSRNSSSRCSLAKLPWKAILVSQQDLCICHIIYWPNWPLCPPLGICPLKDLALRAPRPALHLLRQKDLDQDPLTEAMVGTACENLPEFTMYIIFSRKILYNFMQFHSHENAIKIPGCRARMSQWWHVDLSSVMTYLYLNCALNDQNARTMQHLHVIVWMQPTIKIFPADWPGLRWPRRAHVHRCACLSGFAQVAVNKLLESSEVWKSWNESLRD